MIDPFNYVNDPTEIMTLIDVVRSRSIGSSRSEGLERKPLTYYSLATEVAARNARSPPPWP